MTIQLGNAKTHYIKQFALYDYYGNSFTKLSAVVRELVKLQDQEDGIAKSNADRKHQVKRARYTKKRG